MDKRTKNFKFAAYLRIKGMHPDRVEKISRGKGIFVYSSISDEDWQAFKIDYNQSPFIEYANAIDAVRDLCF